MALTISPVQSAGIMLPILIVMDWVSVCSYRRHWDRNILLLMLPGAIAGIAAGAILAGYLNDQIILLCVGAIALIFPLYAVFKPRGRKDIIAGNKPLGFIAGIIAGFTSFVAHAGGPPFQAYTLPQNLEKRIYAGTAVIFFTVVNFVKLLPYAMLGQLDQTNLTISLILIPLAPVGVLIGAALVKRIDQRVFYRIMYGLIFAVGLKLLWDGLTP